MRGRGVFFFFRGFRPGEFFPFFPFFPFFFFPLSFPRFPFRFFVFSFFFPLSPFGCAPSLRRRKRKKKERKKKRKKKKKRDPLGRCLSRGERQNNRINASKQHQPYKTHYTLTTKTN